MKKERLDVLLVQRGLSASRERAKADIMSGLVFVNGQRVDKAGTTVPEDAAVELRGTGPAFVSRGGLKLEKALDTFGVDPAGKTCLDCGASTGGFSDCLLQRGAAKLYAIDVGYGQLAWPIRSDPRVVVMERTNIRYVTAEQVPDPIDLASLDVSFISLRLVLPAVKELLAPAGEIVCLIKPQFEAGKEKVGKKGVVRDPETHKEVLRAFRENAESLGLGLRGLTFSPIKGPEGNIEYLGHLIRGEAAPLDTDAVAEESHRALAGERE
jgi:23S rRNA (cytidine1920-2'-O)/16S rRNA (cytidine1409-2'-O)-methyltransferase